MPETTILIASYNCVKFIGEAINSIFTQTYKDYEILIIDDGSSDQTENVIDRYPNIRYFKNNTNLGISKSLNRGIGIADSKFIARMDADDIMLGNRLEEQIRFLKNNNDYGMVGSWYQIIDESGRFKQQMTPYTDDKDLRLALLFRNQFAQPTITGHTTLFKELQYDTDFSCAEDHDLWIRFSEVTKIANLPTIHLSYRWYSNNTCNTKQRELKIAIIKLLSRELNKIKVKHSEQELMLHAAVCFGNGKVFFNNENKKTELQNWYSRIFNSSVLKARYEAKWLAAFRKKILYEYCNISE